MDIWTIRKLSKNMNKLNKEVGNTILLVDGSRKRIIAKIKVENPPKEVEIIKKHLFKL